MSGHILVVEPDAARLRKLVQTLRAVRESIEIHGVNSFAAAESLLTEIQEDHEEVALVVSSEDGDANVREQFFARVRAAFADAQILLIAARPESATTMADRTIGAAERDVQIARIAGQLFGRPRAGAADRVLEMIGDQWSPRCHEIKDLFCRHRIAWRWIDVEGDRRTSSLPDVESLDPAELPLLIFPDGTRLANPGDDEIAEKLGFGTEAARESYDLAIVGGGPAGLAAAVYAASEGLRTIVIERQAPGGQAGTSSLIENYLGFPEGLSGAELANRAVAQAERFGTEVMVSKEAVALEHTDATRIVRLNDGSEVIARCVLIATGVRYKKLTAPGADRLAGAGIYYGTAAAEAARFTGREVCLLGGGNSAAQAAMLLARHAKTLRMIMFEDELGATMSKFLVARIRATPNIELMTATTVAEVEGTERLEAIVVENVKTKERRRIATEGLFVSIGATPHTRWLSGTLRMDDAGFLFTGRQLTRSGLDEWDLDRWPLLLETSVPGVFAAGDVRSGSVKRIGSAVGEGAMAVQFVHEYLREQ